MTFKRALDLALNASPYSRQYKRAKFFYNRAAPVLRQIGHSIKADRAKKQEEKFPGAASSSFRLYDQDTPYIWDLTRLKADVNSDGNHDINDRLHDSAYLRGVKICSSWQHLSVADQPIYMNMAILIPKQFQFDSSAMQCESGTAATDGTSALDAFFRNYKADGTRSSDFNDTALTASEKHCLPINTDYYRIVSHKRWKFNPNRSGTSHYGQKRVDFYVPIKRQIRFDKNGTAQRGDQVVLVFWGDYQAASTGDGGSDFSVEMKIVKYFSDIKN